MPQIIGNTKLEACFINIQHATDVKCTFSQFNCNKIDDLSIYERKIQAQYLLRIAIRNQGYAFICFKMKFIASSF